MNLSLCIPGYNRPDFLAWTHEREAQMLRQRIAIASPVRDAA